jgi:hypothetical protein
LLTGFGGWRDFPGVGNQLFLALQTSRGGLDFAKTSVRGCLCLVDGRSPSGQPFFGTRSRELGGKNATVYRFS